MKNPLIWVIIAILVILIGTGLLTYSGICVTVEKNGKKRSVVHWVYIAIGIIFIIIAIIIFWIIARDYSNLRKEFDNAAKAGPGSVLVPLPEKFGRWVTENMASQDKFTKMLGNYMDMGAFKSIKGINASRYRYYGNEPGKEEGDKNASSK